MFLGPTKYGIIKNIRTPQPQATKPSTTGSKRSKGKVTCRNGSRGRKAARGKNTGAKPSNSRTLSSSRQQNYGINPSVPRVSRRNRPPIDYSNIK